jgi:hypothetical protein
VGSSTGPRGSPLKHVLNGELQLSGSCRVVRRHGGHMVASLTRLLHQLIAVVSQLREKYAQSRRKYHVSSSSWCSC